MIFNYLFLFSSTICFVGSEFTWRNVWKLKSFCRETVFTDEEAYNFYNSYAWNRGFGVRRKGIDKSRRPPHEVICRKFCCNKEGVKKLCDKRQDGLTVHRRIDTRVACPAEMHVRLRFLFAHLNVDFLDVYTSFITATRVAVGSCYFFYCDNSRSVSLFI